MRIIKTNKDLSKIWEKEYTFNTNYSYGRDIISYSNNSLAISQNTFYNDVNGAYVKVFSIDEQGDLLWEHEESEPAENGSTPINLVSLNNNTLVYSCEIFKLTDPIYWQNEWNKYPFKFVWLSYEGKELKSKYINIPDTDEMYIYDFIKGDGDYFFAIGTYTEFREKKRYGFITKYNNDGDTIWSRRYQHPDFSEDNIYHIIKGLKEHDNGDLAIVGGLGPKENNKYIWLMRLNENGCLSKYPCDEFVITDTKETELETTFEVFPNPAENLLTLKSIDKGNAIIYNSYGQIIMKYSCSFGDNHIDLSTLSPGIYYINFTSTKGIFFTKKITKI